MRIAGPSGIERIQGTRQLRLTTGSVENVGLVEVEPTIESGKTLSWGSRGWTYQEHQFSTRAMIFANQRV
jgi:hypothetical protein